MRNSDPRVELSLFKDEIMISTPYLPCKQLTGCNFLYGPNLCVPLDPSFGYDASSSLGRVYSRHATAWNWENPAVSFVMKYCPISTTFRNPASIHNLLNLSCCESFSFRSPYCCNRRSWLARSSQSKGTSVLITLSTSEELDCPPTTGCPRSIVKGFVLFTYFCDCSIKTELICRNNYAKK